MSAKPASQPGAARMGRPTTRAVALAAQPDIGGHGDEAGADRLSDLSADGRLMAPDIDFVLRAADVAVDEETPRSSGSLSFSSPRARLIWPRAWRAERIEIDQNSGERAVARGSSPAARRGRRGRRCRAAERKPDHARPRLRSCACRCCWWATPDSARSTMCCSRWRRFAAAAARVLGVLLNDIHPVAEAERYIHEDNVRTIAVASARCRP